jgi:hypothetical protein
VLAEGVADVGDKSSGIAELLQEHVSVGDGRDLVRDSLVKENGHGRRAMGAHGRTDADGVNCDGIYDNNISINCLIIRDSVLTIKDCLSLLKVLVDILAGVRQHVDVEAHVTSLVELGGGFWLQAFLDASSKVGVCFPQTQRSGSTNTSK